MSKIMIVDSDVTMQMDLEEYFESSPHDLVGIVDSENEAVRMARKKEPDIILLEIDLPNGANGIHIAEKIRKQQDDVGIIFVTVCGNPEVIKRSKKANPLAYIFKPLCEGEISAAIEIGLQNRKIIQNLHHANHMLEQQLAEQAKTEKDSFSERMDPIVRWLPKPHVQNQVTEYGRGSQLVSRGLYAVDKPSHGTTKRRFVPVP